MVLVLVAGVANRRLWSRTPLPAAGSVTMAVAYAARQPP
jgi:hypothetical protein